VVGFVTQRGRPVELGRYHNFASKTIRATVSRNGQLVEG
jgi:hypothetical protein